MMPSVHSCKRRATHLLAAAAAAIVAILGITGPGVTAAHATTYTFDDEFNGAAGSQPSGSLWTIVNNSPRSTSELQCYEKSANNVVEDGQGNLQIIALSAPETNCGGITENYTSGRLETKTTFTQKYGTFTMRAKLPTAKGMFPAFWLVGPNSPDPCDGELDIMETIGSDTGSNWTEGNLHGPYISGNCPNTYYSDGGKWTSSGDLSSAYHIYSLTWAPGSLTYAVDGTTFYSIRWSTLPVGQGWVFDTDPEYMILNLAIGGPWAGAPDGNTTFPEVMDIDYIRVTAS
jgi:beta-glucanase (GH16 family)